MRIGILGQRGILIVFCFCSTNLLNAYEITFGYEPFKLRQINFERVITFQSGSLLSVDNSQEENDLWMNMFFSKIKNFWPVPFIGCNLGIETGFAASLMPIKKKWIVPAMDVYFTGTVFVPDSLASGYWETHSLDYSLIGKERYLSEETSMAYIPWSLILEHSMLDLKKLNLGVELQTGFSIFFISTTRSRSDGNPNLLYTTDSRAFFHLAQIFGVSVSSKYYLSERLILFLDIGANGVSNLSDLQNNNPGGGVLDSYTEGYRFDGLRYNTKLGVSWKI
ncbi:MAG: hypothetical protein AAB091_02355 [Elusimicrobiota bacterium]|mgnify:CR=1 FL=1